MVKRGKSSDPFILIICYTFVALWYWLAVQELAQPRSQGPLLLATGAE